MDLPTYHSVLNVEVVAVKMNWSSTAGNICGCLCGKKKTLIWNPDVHIMARYPDIRVFGYPYQCMWVTWLLAAEFMVWYLKQSVGKNPKIIFWFYCHRWSYLNPNMQEDTLLFPLPSCTIRSGNGLEHATTFCKLDQTRDHRPESDIMVASTIFFWR